jgi:hypothetical protein
MLQRDTGSMVEFLLQLRLNWIAGSEIYGDAESRPARHVA